MLHQGRKHWKNILFFIIVTFTVIVPWTTRNYLTFHRFLPIGVGLGDNLWKGSYLPWDGDYNYKDLSDMNVLIRGKDPFEAQDILLSDALKNIRQQPMGYIHLCFKKIYRLWCWVPGNKRVLEEKPTLKFLLYMIHLPLLFCFILGCVSSLKNLSPPMIIVLCPLVYFTLFHALLFAIPRYRIPIIPLFLIFAALGLQNLIAFLNPKT